MSAFCAAYTSAADMQLHPLPLLSVRSTTSYDLYFIIFLQDLRFPDIGGFYAIKDEDVILTKDTL